MKILSEGIQEKGAKKKTGGFPEIISEKDDFVIKKYVKELVIDKIIYIDIPEVFKIDEPALLQSLISIISSSEVISTK